MNCHPKKGRFCDCPPQGRQKAKCHPPPNAKSPQKKTFENRLAGRCAPIAVPLVDDVVETSEMARQNGKELSYPRHRQDQVCVGVFGRCFGSIVAKKLASLGRSSTRFHLDKA